MKEMLSVNWVWKESLDWKICVRRYFDKDNLYKLNNILEFYDSVEFENRPKLIKVGENFFNEDFIEGDVISSLTSFDMKNILENITNLYKYHNEVQKLQYYLLNKFDIYAWSMSSSESIKETMKFYLHTLLGSVPDNAMIKTGYIHKDVKPWNVIRDSNQQLIFIDWEWVQFGHIMADIQKIFHLFLHYNPNKCDAFINQFSKKITEDRDIIVLLDTYYYMITTWLHLSKWKIDIDQFKKLMDLKFNKFVKWKLI